MNWPTTFRKKYMASRDQLIAALQEDRAEERTIVLTNGTFDILHVGHVRALEHARSLGDVLVVGVNADVSVRAYKGPGRPVVSENERAELIAALHCVDYVVLFEETTAVELIKAVRPNIHAKGRDYSEDSVPEGELVRSLGGQVAIVGDPKDHSATEMISRMKDAED